jgi:uncharacterized protein YlxP (DUF503 family)
VKINVDSYKVALLNDYEQAVKAIEEAESYIAKLTGNEVTLIAYEKTEE